MITELIKSIPLPSINLLDKDIFIRYIGMVYLFMEGSVELIRAASIDAKPGKVKDYYITHLEEEKDHPGWLLDDLIACGIPKPMHNHEIANLHKLQHDLLKKDSNAFLGFMLASEGRRTPMHIVEGLELVYGKRLLQSIRLHAEDDVNHEQDILEMIYNHAKESIDLIEKNAIHTAIAVNFILKPLTIARLEGINA